MISPSWKKKIVPGNLHADINKAVCIQITHDALVQALEEVQSEWERDRNNEQKEL